MDMVYEAQPFFHAESLPDALSHISPHSWWLVTASAALKQCQNKQLAQIPVKALKEVRIYMKRSQNLYETKTESVITVPVS